MNITEEVRKQTALSDADGEEARKAYLAAIVKTAGSLTLKSNKLGLTVENKSMQPVLSALGLIKELYGAEVEFAYSSAQKLYSASVRPGEAERIFADLLPETAESRGGLGRKFASDEEASAYVRGLFAVCGSAYAPGSDDGGGYHIEFTFFDEDAARELAEYFAARDIAMHVTHRRDMYGAYCKSGTDVSGVLAFMGAYESVFALSDVMMLREANNNINRGVNCTLANMDKAQRAAGQLLGAIARLREDGSLDRLDDKLRAVCDAREAHPEFTMAQLAKELGISKSGLNHRIEKILKEAENGR